MITFTDKNIIIIRNKNEPSFISVDGEMAKIGTEFITYKNKVKIIKQGTSIQKQNMEILKVGLRKVIIYNVGTRAWRVIN